MVGTIIFGLDTQMSGLIDNDELEKRAWTINAAVTINVASRSLSPAPSRPSGVTPNQPRASIGTQTRLMATYTV
jgi:hypothetical protein